MVMEAYSKSRDNYFFKYNKRQYIHGPTGNLIITLGIAAIILFVVKYRILSAICAMVGNKFRLDKAFTPAARGKLIQFDDL